MKHESEIAHTQNTSPQYHSDSAANHAGLELCVGHGTQSGSSMNFPSNRNFHY